MTLQIHSPARLLWIPSFIIVVIVIAGVFSGEFNRTNSLDDNWAQAQISCCIISRFLLEAKFSVPQKHGGNYNIIHPFAALMMGKTHACIAWHWAQTCLNISYLDGLTDLFFFFFFFFGFGCCCFADCDWVQMGAWYLPCGHEWAFLIIWQFCSPQAFPSNDVRICLASSTLLPILFFSAHSSNQSLNFCWASFVAKFFGSQILFCKSSRKLED
jgi:hypothetical protein